MDQERYLYQKKEDALKQELLRQGKELQRKNHTLDALQKSQVQPHLTRISNNFISDSMVQDTSMNGGLAAAAAAGKMMQPADSLGQY